MLMVLWSGLIAVFRIASYLVVNGREFSLKTPVSDAFLQLLMKFPLISEHLQVTLSNKFKY